MIIYLKLEVMMYLTLFFSIVPRPCIRLQLEIVASSTSVFSLSNIGELRRKSNTVKSRWRRTRTRRKSRLVIVIFKFFRNRVIINDINVQPVGWAVTHLSLERKFYASNFGTVKSDALWRTACHRCDVSSKGAMLRGRNGAKMDPANSVHVSTQYI